MIIFICPSIHTSKIAILGLISTKLSEIIAIIPEKVFNCIWPRLYDFYLPK